MSNKLNQVISESFLQNFRRSSRIRGALTNTLISSKYPLEYKRLQFSIEVFNKPLAAATEIGRCLLESYFSHIKFLCIVYRIHGRFINNNDTKEIEHVSIGNVKIVVTYRLINQSSFIDHSNSTQLRHIIAV